MKSAVYLIITLLVVAAASTAWHADQAKSAIDAAVVERDQVWAEAFKQYNVSMEEAAEEERKKIGDSDLIMRQKYEWLETQFIEAEAKLKETTNALAAQRRKAPLSADCNACRVPAERLRWRTTVDTGAAGSPADAAAKGAAGAASAPAGSPAVRPSK